ncbi:hypothetical protein EV368DRAFT_84253 [Lentinula lateritia]|nr:hypothetical protein EV368DRAFT_84253 [Lentinula lateritia]
MSLPREYALLKNGEMMLSELDYQGMFKGIPGSSDFNSRHPRRNYTFSPPGSLGATDEPGGSIRSIPNVTYITTSPNGEQQSPANSPVPTPRSPRSPGRSDTLSPSMFSPLTPGPVYLRTEEWHMLGFPPQGRSPIYGPASPPGSPRRSPEYARSPRDISSPSMSSRLSPRLGVWTAEERRVHGLSPPSSSHPIHGAHTPGGRRDSSASASSQAQPRSPRTPRHQATNHDSPGSPLSSILYELGLPRPDPNDPSSLTTTYEDYPHSPGRWPIEWGAPSFYGLSPSPVPQSPGPSGSQRSSTMSAGGRSLGASSRHGSTSPYLHKARSPTLLQLRAL